MPISGVLNVNTANSTPIAQSVANASFGDLQITFSELKSLVSQIYTVAAEMKKIAIFIQSGDLPIAPL